MTQMLDLLKSSTSPLLSNIPFPEYWPKIMEELHKATAIDSTNVTQYWGDLQWQGSYSTGSFDLGDMHPIVPPFPITFCETAFSSRLQARGWPLRLGGLFLTCKLPEKLPSELSGFLGIGVSDNPNGWLVVAELFTQDTPCEVERFARIEFYLDSNGRIWGDGDNANVYPTWATNKVLSTEEQIGLLGQYLVPLLLAFQFMHCKNVIRIDNQPKGNRHAIRHNRPIRTRFYTLDIRPMREILQHEGDIEHTGLKRALHICRGHFATYESDAPLFGKYAGTFWRPMHVRGNVSEGAVAKDYSVDVPDKP